MMMKKVILASALAASMIAGSAQAVTVYDKDNTKVDIYSRIYAFYENSNSGQIKGNDSRFGFKTSSQVSEDLSVFARAEFRYSADESGNTQFNRRNTYVGLKGGFGTLTIGNFDSIYYSAVSNIFDLSQQVGYIALGSGSIASRADSIAYSTAAFGNLNLHVQARHYADTTTVSGDEEFVLQLAGTYSMDNLKLGLGIVNENEDANASFTDTLIGFSAEYAMSKALSLKAMIESRDEMHIAVGVNYNYGKGDVFFTLGDDDNRTDSSHYTLGMTYKFSKPMRFFAEFTNRDWATDDVIAMGLRYDF
jgi:predicted porin